jgi:hypothetical protein
MILRAFCFAAIAAVCSSESVWDDISDADDFVEMGASTRALLSGGSGGGSGAGQPAPAPTPTLHAQLVFDGTCDGGANALTKEECMLYAAESNLLPHNNSINIRHSEFRNRTYPHALPCRPLRPVYRPDTTKDRMAAGSRRCLADLLQQRHSGDEPLRRVRRQHDRGGRAQLHRGVSVRVQDGRWRRADAVTDAEHLPDCTRRTHRAVAHAP